MTTNREFLNELAQRGDALQAWFDSEHVENPNGTLETLSKAPTLSQMFGFLRSNTDEENEAYRKMLDKNGIDLGVNVFELDDDDGEAEHQSDFVNCGIPYHDGDVVLDSGIIRPVDDSREKLESEIREHCYHVYDTPDMRMGGGHWQVDVSRETVFGWLDRQAAITERGMEKYAEAKQRMWESAYDRSCELEEKVEELTHKIDALTAENLSLARQHGDALAQVDIYREAIGAMLDVADELHRIAKVYER